MGVKGHREVVGTQGVVWTRGGHGDTGGHGEKRAEKYSWVRAGECQGRQTCQHRTLYRRSTGQYWPLRTSPRHQLG